MSSPAHAPESHGHDDSHEESKFRIYVEIAMLLAVITGIEIVAVYLPFAKWILITSLVVLSAIKFLFVIFYFMHLRWDKPFCTILFFIGLVLAEASLPLPAVAYYGTVGAVARDREDRLAAATSTGGMTNKRFGRVGDAPIIGAGTWADGKCAVSATGWGEYFIRSAVAHDLCARVAYRGDAVAKAADEVLAGVAKLGGDGGVIVLDADGNAALSYNSAGMYRGTIDADGTVSVAIYAD